MDETTSNLNIAPGGRKVNRDTAGLKKPEAETKTGEASDRILEQLLEVLDMRRQELLNNSTDSGKITSIEKTAIESESSSNEKENGNGRRENIHLQQSGNGRGGDEVSCSWIRKIYVDARAERISGRDGENFQWRDDRYVSNSVLYHAPMVVFRKKVNGTYYVVEAVPDSKYKKMWIVSAYMDKKGGGTQAPDAKNPRNTPDAFLASSPQMEGVPSNITIAPGGKKVNRDAVGSKNQGAKNAASTNAVLAELQNAEGHADEDVAARLQEELVKKQLLSELEQKQREKRLRETLDEAQRRQRKR